MSKNLLLVIQRLKATLADVLDLNQAIRLNESHHECQKNLIVEDNGFEPLTPCVQGRCSSQLS